MTVLTIAPAHTLPEELVRAGMLPGKRMPAARATPRQAAPDGGLLVDLALVPVSAGWPASFLPMNMAAMLDCPARDLVPHFGLATDCAEMQAAGSPGRSIR